MNLYKVNQVVLCQVATYRTIEATSMEEAMGKVAGIETATPSATMKFCPIVKCYRLLLNWKDH